MSEILFINACVRENSRTLELAEDVLGKLNGNVSEVKLYDIKLLPLDADGLETRGKAAENKDFSAPLFDLAKQFANADTVVIAAPYWDLMFPAALKLYFEAITVNGLTFMYSEKGIPKGLCKAERLIYVTTSGGPIVQSFGYDYAAALAKSFYGIRSVECVSAQGLDIRGADVESLMQAAKSSFVS